MNGGAKGRKWDDLEQLGHGQIFLSAGWDFDPPHLHLAAPQGVIPVEFCGDL